MAAMAEVLRDKITNAESIYRVAKDSGVDYAIVYRFLHGEREPRLGAIEKLADYFGLELKPIRAPKRKK